MRQVILILALAVAAADAYAARFDHKIPMRQTQASTFYVGGYVSGLGEVDMMVDTGSSYTTINEEALKVLQENGAATYVRDLAGIMADGTRKIVPIYRIENMSIGNRCTLRNVEAAVFPGDTRYILGLSALKLAAPFVFSMEPPTLLLSNCGVPLSPGSAARAQPAGLAELADSSLAVGAR